MKKKPAADLELALLSLTDAKFKRTGPREAVLRFLTREHGPFSVDEIFQGAKKGTVKRTGLDVVTVYRCLATFEKLRLVRRCDFGDGIARYEFQAGEDHHHHHVTCSRCRETRTLATCRLPKLERQVTSLGYADVTHSLEFFGLCAKCR